MCESHGNGIDIFQSGEGGTCTAKAEEGEMALASGTKVHRAGEVALVSKIHIFRLN